MIVIDKILRLIYIYIYEIKINKLPAPEHIKQKAIASVWTTQAIAF
ncbi:hypothetical protein WKK05_38335 (plasmid) [Nostoc sp. UHCC 0302]